MNFNSAGATTSGGTFNSNGGTLAGSGSLTIDSGVFDWIFGTMTGTGTTTIAAPATLNLSGTGSKNLEGSRVLTNDGTATLSGGYVQFTASGSTAPGAVLDNNGVFNATSDADILFNNIGGGQPSFSNDGTFNKSGAGTTTSIGVAFSNTGTVTVNSGTLSLTNALTNLSAGTLTGGTYRAVDGGSGATFTSVGTAVSTIASTTTMELSGANSNMAFAGTNLATSLVNNAGTLRIYNGRTFTMTNALNNTGTFELGGASLADATLTSGGNIVNSAIGTIFGHGTINNTILNSGTVRAANGTLVINGGKIDGQSGTIQIDSGATLNLSSASGASDADFLVHNGAGLNLGSNDILVGVDYTNANFGTGNAFNHRANVAGAGLILANPAVTQTLGGSVTDGGTALATMSFGNIHTGDLATLNYQINNVGGTGPNLRGAIQTSVNGGNLTDARLSGVGVTASNFGPITTGGNSGDLAVTFNATSAGAFVGQQVRIINNFDNVADQLLQFTGAAYRYANPTAHTPEPIDFGSFHVGDTAPSQALSITNNLPADGFSEALNALIGSPTGGVTTNGGAFSLLAPSMTDNTSLVVGIPTATVGNKSGTATITLTSDGTGSSGLGLTTLAAQTVNVTGSVFRLASATDHAPEPINFGNFHVGDTAPSQLLSITNNVPEDGFSESLDASLANPTGGVTTSGSFAGLVPGATDNSNLAVGIDTNTAGNRSGTATIALTSNGTGNSGLGLTSLAGQTVNVTGSVYRLADASPHTPEPIDFGILHVGDPAPSQTLSITNSTVNDGFSERLEATIGSATGGMTTNGGFFNGLVPEATNSTNLSVGIDTGTAGDKSGTATITLTSDGTGTSGLGTTSLASQTVNVAGQVNNFAVADVVKIAGAGAFSMTGANQFSLDLGSIVQGQTALVAELGVENDAAAPSDSLAGSFTLAAPAFALTGFGPFAGVAAGGTLDDLFVELNSSAAGMFSGQITLQPQSTNPTPFSMNLAPITINVIGSVGLGGDYNRNGTVDAADYVMWRNSVDDIVDAFSAADGDGSGTIDPGDYDVWRAHFGQTAGSGAGVAESLRDSGLAVSERLPYVAVPEPGAFVLLALGLPALWRHRRLQRPC